jgi:hypothetical protein
LFFEQAIPAGLARKLGAHILRSRAILTPRFDVFMVRWGVAAG